MRDPENPDRRLELFGLQEGEVTDNEDPRGLGRVRIRIPGLIEPESAWAFPMGIIGGGKKNRGIFWPPEVGSEVYVFFKNGDPDYPRYLGGHWGAPGGDTETPDASEDGDPEVRVISFGGYEIVVDTREGSKAFRIRDQDDEENLLEYDGETKLLTISATTGIKLASTGQVDVLLFTVNEVPAGLGKL
jgi:uncharacterized protein involved in type VI secretion and phage assembly